MSQPDVGVICVLCTNHWHSDLWKAWRASGGKALRAKLQFVVHPKPSHADAMAPEAIVRPVHTSWGDASLVRAELVMLREALNRYPRASACVIISGDTVPVQSAARFYHYFARQPSVVPLITGVVGEDPARPYRAGPQFIALTARHARYLLRNHEAIFAVGSVEWREPGYERPAPDESLLHTTLYRRYGKREFRQEEFMEYIATGDGHMKQLTVKELDSIISRAAAGAVFCARKIGRGAAAEARTILERRGVL